MSQSEAHAPSTEEPDPIHLAKTIHIPNERPFIEVPDSEVDKVILSALPWKSPDHYGVQMGHVQQAWPVINRWVRIIFQVSVRLGAKPTPFKNNTATPIHKQAKKDKTSPKAWRPVENYEHILAKPLERLLADRLSFDAESLGFIDSSQYGGPRPQHSAGGRQMKSVEMEDARKFTYLGFFMFSKAVWPVTLEKNIPFGLRRNLKC
ncbi:hypothetical protein K438DRAFT_1850150 [Mycena galopus ATCC 62051]|nr:hypothetical protein K438DRAFT_1850150 [Mycena galopus ATCC 62051]